MKTIALLSTAVLALVLSGCDAAKGDGPHGDHVEPGFVMAEVAIEVHYTDSSVPPEYHRSWELTADAEQIKVVVDSYGDVVARKRATTPAGAWDDLAVALNEIDEVGEVGDADGCAGGTAITVDIDSPDRDGGADVTACGDPGGDERDRILELLEPITGPVDLAELTDGRLPTK